MGAAPESLTVRAPSPLSDRTCPRLVACNHRSVRFYDSEALCSSIFPVMRLCVRRNQAVAVCEGSKPKTIFDLKLAKNRGKVVPDRGLSDTQPQSNLLVLK